MLAALVASCASFAVGAGLDWIWELAVLPVIFLLAAAALLAGDLGSRRAGPGLGPILGAVAVFAMVLIALPLLSVSSVQSSRELFSAGRLDEALEQAEDAERYQPFAGTPYLQQALVLEGLGQLGKASIEAQEAADREPTNWRPWFVLSRIEAQRDKARSEAALRAFRRAAKLNPASTLFADAPEPAP